MRRSLLLVLVILLALLAPVAVAHGARGICDPTTCSVPATQRVVTPRTVRDAATIAPPGRTAMRVNVLGAPAGSTPAVQVLGPRGLRRTISRSTVLRLRPGRYRLVAKPVAGPTTTAFARHRTTVVRLRPRVRARVGVRYAHHLDNRTRVADPAAVAGVAAGPGDARTITLADPTGAVVPGSLLSVGVGPNTPSGALVRVEQVDRAGGTVVARGVVAPLTDIGPQADIRAVGQISIGDAAGRKQARIAAKKGGGAFGKPYRCSRGGSVGFSGDVDFSAGVDVGVSWGGFWKPLTVYAHAKAHFHGDANLKVTLTGKAGCELDLDLLPEDIRFQPITFSVGPVPVVIVPKLNFRLSGRAQFEATATTTMRPRFDGELGARWDGDSLHPINSFKWRTNYERPEVDAALEVKAAVGPKLIFDVYDVAGPYLTTDVYLRYRAALNERPWWRFNLGVQVGAGLRFKVWKLGLDVNKDDLYSREWMLAEASDPPPPQAPELSALPLPRAEHGRRYSARMRLLRGTATRFAVVAGALPAGLRLDGSTGRITGTPTGFGTRAVTIQASDARGRTDRQAYVLSVRTEPIAVTSAALPDGTVGSELRARLVASGSVAPYTWTLASGALPGGVRLGTDGSVSGTPTQDGRFAVTVAVRGADGKTATRRLALTVAPAPLVVSTAALPEAEADQAYRSTVEARGGRGERRWSIAAGGLPAGLTLDAASGVVAGTPTAPGSGSVTVAVADADGRTATRTLALVVRPAPLGVSTAALPAGKVEVAYRTSLEARGGRGERTWSVVAGALPAGLTLDPSGVVAGTPTAVGTATATVAVTDADGRTAQRALELRVAPAGLEVTTESLPAAVEGTAYAASLEALGGAAPLTWSIAEGALPTGIVLDARTGALAGTPAAAGTATFTVRATDAEGQSAQRALSLAVAGAPKGVPVDLAAIDCWSPTGCLAVGYRHTFRWDGSSWSLAHDGQQDDSYYQGDDLSCVSATRCVQTSGASALVWDGTDWTSVGRPPAAAGRQTYVQQVDCFSATACELVGSERVTATDAQTGQSWRLEGTTWGRKVAITDKLYGLDCVGASACVAVQPFAGLTRFDGTSWTAPVKAGAIYHTDVACRSATSCVVLDGHSDAVAVLTGTSMSAPAPAGVAGGLGRRVSCVAGGSRCAAAWSSSAGTQLGIWSGGSWTLSGPVPGMQVRSISCPADDLCFAVGSKAEVRRFDGTQWREVAPFAYDPA